MTHNFSELQNTGHDNFIYDHFFSIVPGDELDAPEGVEEQHAPRSLNLDEGEE